MAVGDPYAYLNVPGQPQAPQWIATSFIGPSFVGYSIHFLLWGAVAHAIIIYLGSDLYQRDACRTKAILWSIFFLDTACMVINFVSNFRYGTVQVRDANTLYMIQPLDSVPLLLLGILACIVQTTLALRASNVFGRRKVLKKLFIGSMLFLIAVCWLGNVASSILNLMICFGTQDRALPFTYNNMAGTYLWLAAVIDLAISFTLFFQLRYVHTGSSADGLMRTISHTALKTAIPTTVMAIGGAILATAFPTSQLSTINAVFAINYPLPSVYTFSFLYTLSSRETLRSPMRYGGARTFDSEHGPDHLAIEVEHAVVVKTEVDLDGLLFRSEPRRAAPGVTAIPTPRPSSTKWDREADTADW